MLHTAEDEDFESRTGRIVFLPRGVRQQFIRIPIYDDQMTEETEPLVVSFSSEDIPSDMQDMIPTPVVTIIDNDISE